MSSRRTARVASMIREVVGTAVLTELRDPRIRNVTVLSAEVSPDLRYAKVYVSVLGDDKTASLTMHGLNSARGYLQSKVAERMRTRYTPELRFVLDLGVKKSIETARILREVLPQEPAADLPPDHDESVPLAAMPETDESEDTAAGEEDMSGNPKTEQPLPEDLGQ
ncbi:MAG: 30S ribosome-binding factor RbfA [Planctomycetaceae bacterium]|nr:30S ribosome-binding factor RbfA [Planctomycetaceae bacterium]